MKKVFLNCMLLLCALIVGSGDLWAQADYSGTHTSNVTLSSGTNCKVVISNTEYDGKKLGSNGSGGSCSFSAPTGTKYIHIHVAAWKSKAPTFSYKVGTGTATNISVTSDNGVSSNSPFTLSNQSKATTDYYKVVTLNSALASATTITLTSTGERVVIWGVNTEVESSDPSSEATFTNTAPSINYPATKTYSQAPTTAAGYTGSISYSMTANTAGASINALTGVVTVTQGGSVTVKAIAAAVPGSFSGSEASYTLTVNDTRSTLSNEQFAWSAASASVTYGAGDNVFPNLINTEDVTVTYSSSAQAAASIDENTGVITLKDYNGSTTISAIFAGNDDYKAKTVEYTLTVAKAPFVIQDGVFDFNEAAAGGEDYDSGIEVTTNGNHYDTNPSTWTAGNVTMEVSGKYRWWQSSGPAYSLRFYGNCSAAFSVPSGYVITKIVSTGGNFSNSDIETLSGNTWTGASQNVTLSTSTNTTFNKFTITYTTANQTIKPSTMYSTYVTSYAMDFSSVSPSGLIAYVATGADALTVTIEPVNAAVPANTPLVLKGEAGTTYTIPVAASADTPSPNYLVAGTGEEVYGAGIYVLSQQGGNYVFAPVDGTYHPTIATNKAYLDISGLSSAPSLLRIVEAGNNATYINNIESSEEAVKFIQNGKLFIKKNGIVYDVMGHTIH